MWYRSLIILCICCFCSQAMGDIVVDSILRRVDGRIRHSGVNQDGGRTTGTSDGTFDEYRGGTFLSSTVDAEQITELLIVGNSLTFSGTGYGRTDRNGSVGPSVQHIGESEVYIEFTPDVDSVFSYNINLVDGGDNHDAIFIIEEVGGSTLVDVSGTTSVNDLLALTAGIQYRFSIYAGADWTTNNGHDRTSSFTADLNISPVSVPEPTSLAFLLMVASGSAIYTRNKSFQRRIGNK